jgi:ABC-type xylose transport system permease subunit
MSILNRLKAPTPRFFRHLRNIGLTMAAVGGALLTAPVSLPAVLVTVGGYLTVAGTVIGAVSQATVSTEEAAVQENKE